MKISHRSHQILIVNRLRSGTNSYGEKIPLLQSMYLINCVESITNARVIDHVKNFLDISMQEHKRL